MDKKFPPKLALLLTDFFWNILNKWNRFKGARSEIYNLLKISRLFFYFVILNQIGAFLWIENGPKIIKILVQFEKRI